MWLKRSKNPTTVRHHHFYCYSLPLEGFSHYTCENENGTMWEWALCRYIRLPFTVDPRRQIESVTEQISFWLDRNAVKWERWGNHMGKNGSKPEGAVLITRVNARAVLCLRVRRCLTLLFVTLRWSVASIGPMTLRSTEMSRWRW